MPIIYEPRGKAREYCDLAANLYRGCSHGCRYCYAPSATFTQRDKFVNARPRNDVILQLKKEAPNYKDREIHLCFTCDPYQQIDVEHRLTRAAIGIFHENNITVRILTKGGFRSVRDFDLLEANPNKSWYGATLTFLNEADSVSHEPEAALPSERMDVLKSAHSRGIKTWVSLEPVIDPAQTLEIVRLTHYYVTAYKVGKLNHNKMAKLVDWHKFAFQVTELLDSYGCEYYVKDDLKKYLKEAPIA